MDNINEHSSIFTDAVSIIFIFALRNRQIFDSWTLKISLVVVLLIIAFYGFLDCPFYYTDNNTKMNKCPDQSTSSQITSAFLGLGSGSGSSSGGYGDVDTNPEGLVNYSVQTWTVVLGCLALFARVFAFFNYLVDKATEITSAELYNSFDQMPAVSLAMSKAVPTETPKTMLGTMFWPFVTAWMTYYQIILVVMGVFAVNEPLVHFYLIADYLRGRDTKTVLKAIIRGSGDLFRSMTVGVCILVVFIGIQFQLSVSVHTGWKQSWGTPELQSEGALNGYRWIYPQSTGTLFQWTWRGFMHGVRGDLDYTGEEGGTPAWGTHMGEQVMAVVGMLWVAIFTFLLEGIVAGQIVDSFAVIRDEENARREDMQRFCLVCSLDRQIMDNECGGYLQHTAVDHNPWSYIFFLHHLKQKPKTSYDGIESYVAECIKEFGQRRSRFIPMRDSLTLQIQRMKKGLQEGQDQVELKLDSVLEELAKLTSLICSQAEQSGTGPSGSPR